MKKDTARKENVVEITPKLHQNSYRGKASSLIPCNIKKLRCFLVEAAGVEPASEMQFFFYFQAIRLDSVFSGDCLGTYLQKF
jgi:hypothetical protein